MTKLTTTVALTIGLLLPVQGCGAPEYTLANPCLELNAESGGTSAEFLTPTGPRSYVLTDGGFLVQFDVNCLPADTVPELRITPLDGGAETPEVLSGSSICTPGAADPQGARGWSCEVVLPPLNRGETCDDVGDTLLEVVLSPDYPDGPPLASVITPFALSNR